MLLLPLHLKWRGNTEQAHLIDRSRKMSESNRCCRGKGWLQVEKGGEHVAKKIQTRPTVYD